ncbi:MAG TPA: tetratricopeptide repeat protein [Bacteroidales bacterium]|nr:tetratricopeptide repeat protein [Bacteroidales bacterium]
MSGLIEGYSYDIFISYRQNDNKYDGWVTEFVTNLKKELEATIKEKLTIYFDENPIDGLLETHLVDQSLTEKLKCLIFIPVISQTYCDSKSYAWQNEFCFFNKLVKEDPFGMNIRLPNGNVASRILAVKIHNIDQEDIKIIETEIGEKLRSIDFIYKSSGVNRPLRSNEDHPGTNLNKTYYRDQINKVANSVKEIISALLKAPKPEESAVMTELTRKISEVNRRSWKKILSVTIVLALLAIITTFYVRGKPSNIEKSIAVLPFRNDSPSDSNAYFINELMEDILNNLQKIKDVRIISRTSVEQYRNTSKSIPQIAKELGVNYIVEGSGQRHKNSVRLNVKLIRARKETYLWGKQYDQKITKTEDITKLQSTIAQSIVSELEGTITPQEKKLIEKIPTSSLSAYDFYRRGREELSKFWIDVNDKSTLFKAEKLFNKSLELDPRFAEAIIGQAEVYWHYRTYLNRVNVLDSVMMLTDIALSYDDKLAGAYVIKGWCYDEEGRSDKALEQYSKAIELNPNDWKAYFGLAELYDFEDPLKSLANLRMAASLTHGALEMPTILRHIGGELLITGFTEKAATYFTRAFDLDGDTAIYLSCLGGIEQNQGNYQEAIEYYEMAIRIKKNYSEVIHDLALYSQLIGRKEESLKYYRELNASNELNYNCHRMGYALWQNGFTKESEKYFRDQIEYCNSVMKNGHRSDLIIYAYYDLACIYAFKGEKKKAFQYLRLFNKSTNCFTYMLLLIKNDPFMDNLKNEPEFIQIVNEMDNKYKSVHERVGIWLETQEDL